MSFGSRIRELKDSILLRGLSDPNHWVLKMLGHSVGAGSASGQNVTADSALKLSVVYACIKALAETVASLPLMLYERDGDSKKPAPNHPMYDLVHNAPNDYQTSYEWREGLVANLNLRGNTINQKVQKGSGRIEQLIPLNPANVTMRREGSALWYDYKHEDGKEEKFPSDKIWHVKNMPISCNANGNLPEGIWGASPIQIARDTIGLALSADDYGSRFFANMAQTGMALKFPPGVKLGDSAREFLKNSLAEYSKPENKFKSIILEDGGDLTKIGMSNEDSQFLESRQFSVEEIARIYRVPPILIGHPTNTMTFASAEQIFLAFVVFTIRPLCVRFEQSMNQFLLSKKDRAKYFFEFNLAGLLRGDLSSRYAAFQVARTGGWLNVDEIRAMENLNPLPDGKGKIYLEPLNMKEAGTPDPKQAPAPNEPTPEPNAGGNDDEAGT